MPGAPAHATTAAVNGTRLAYDVAGSEAAPALVFVHAGIADRRMWDEQMGAFAGWCVVRYDLRGFGDSGDAVGAFSHRADLAGLLDHLHIERAVLVGCSLGGTTALDFALEHPNRVRALVVVSARPSGSPPSAELKQIYEDEDAAFKRGDLQATNEIDLCAWVDGPMREPGEVSPAMRARMQRLNADVLARDFRAQSLDAQPQPLYPPAIGRLASVAAPVLVIAGEVDREVICDAASVLASAIPDARLAVIPNVAHMVNLEAPVAFNAEVARFLAELTAG